MAGKSRTKGCVLKRLKIPAAFIRAKEKRLVPVQKRHRATERSTRLIEIKVGLGEGGGVRGGEEEFRCRNFLIKLPGSQSGFLVIVKKRAMIIFRAPLCPDANVGDASIL